MSKAAGCNKAELLARLAGPGGDFDLFNDSETALILDVKAATLAQWRWRGKGPEFVKINGRNVRTTGGALKRYLAVNTCSFATEAKAA